MKSIWQDDARQEFPRSAKLSRHAWGVLICRRLDHHLKQFGA